jgi:hypothetical protein
VDEVLDWLQAQRYQSDERFVESRLNSRAPRLGLTRIRQELSRHGVELDSDTVRTLRQSEVRRARVWRKRFGQPPADLRERASDALSRGPGLQRRGGAPGAGGGERGGLSQSGATVPRWHRVSLCCTATSHATVHGFPGKR